jgi:polar amino acid transport system permease protein
MMSTISLYIGASWPLLIVGAITTVQLWVSASCFSLLLGTIWGIFRSNAARIPYFSIVIDGITFILRGLPFFIQLLIVYFMLPSLIGIHISAYTASLLALTFCSSGYVSQIVRGGINAISVGQWEAAQVVGYSFYQTVWYIVLPQAVRVILPALVGECDQLLKSTAVLSSIGILELTGAGRNIITQEMNPISIYTLLALLYLSMSALLAWFSRWLERRLSV